MEAHVKIFDTTLRDGEQSPGATMNVAEKLRIAQQLEKLNVDIIEAGFPISSDGDFEAVKKISQLITRCEVAGLARANPQDIDRAWEAIKKARFPRIHTFISTSDIHLQYQIKKSKEEVLKITTHAQLFAKGDLKLTSAALHALETAAWPGNVRQLENAIARGVLLAEGKYVHPRDLAGEARVETVSPATTPGGAKPVTLREMEQHLIVPALNETSGNRTHAAKLLGISVRTLRNKLHEYRQLAFAKPGQSSQVA